MGVRNYLIEGLSGTGKTSVCDELQRRGHRAVHGDRELAYVGDPETGEPRDVPAHEHHVWHVDQVRALVADKADPATFFCGGSRNSSTFIDLFDDVFVLVVDLATLNRRLDERPDDEWADGQPVDASGSCDGTRRGRTSRRTASRSTPPHPSPTSSTTSSVASTQGPDRTPQSGCAGSAAARHCPPKPRHTKRAAMAPRGICGLVASWRLRP